MKTSESPGSSDDPLFTEPYVDIQVNPLLLNPVAYELFQSSIDDIIMSVVTV
ncbi:MAG: hypothetical protein ACFFBD_00820 [Candidatus Hodarchaeota archaeon]